jgi:hypothetical protein
MAISLKDQLTKAQQLKEVSYHTQKFDTNYYTKYYDNHGQGRDTGKRLFYDFYAMEFLWSFLGSGQIPKGQRGQDSVGSKGHRFLNDASVRVIDDVYEQVTYATADRLIGYLRAAVHQEFRYIMGQNSFTQFRQAIISTYNTNGGQPISQEKYLKIIESEIPQMSSYPESVRRILKFAKIYGKKMGTQHGTDPYDMVFPEQAETEPMSDEPENPLTPVADPEEPEGEEIPDAPGGEVDPETLAMPATHDKWFGKGGNVPPPSKSSFENPTAKGDEIETDDEETFDEPTPLTESSINIGVLKPVYKAALLAGLTLQDIWRGYTYMTWSSAYGGPRWAAGVEALIKLLDARKKNDMEAINHVIDHIYDLQHNSGSLLNKGPMYVTEDDLNRRYKITDILRFLPYVSSTVKRLIQRYHTYLRRDKEHADTEANMENLLKAPTVAINSEEMSELTKLGFGASGPGAKINIRFFNKKKQAVSGVYYELKKYKVGSFSQNGQFQEAEGKPIKYVVADNLKADVKSFDTFKEAVGYLLNFKNDFQHTSSGFGQTGTSSEKDQYIAARTKIRLPVVNEEALLKLNMCWDHKTRYYKAFLPNDKQYLMYAFSDNTMLTTYKYQDQYEVFNHFDKMLGEISKSLSLNGVLEHPNKAEIEKELEAIKSGKMTSYNAPSYIPPTVKKYSLDVPALDMLTDLVKTKLPHTPQNDYVVQAMDNGMYGVMHKNYHVVKPVFKVGKALESPFGKPYTIKSASGGEKMFTSWDELYNFMNQHLFTLAGLKQPSVVTPMAYGDTSNLPANSTSKAAYSVHAGLNKPPTSTIRLTDEDEKKLTDAGFKPQLVSGNVWYIHSGTGDVAKFYPNNSAKMVFSTMKSAGMNESIEKMIAWILTKYNATVSKSPLKTGASVTPPPTAAGSTQTAAPTTPNAPTAPTPSGVQAGVMFLGDIKHAGFQWTPSLGYYVDGNNTLKIAPNRSSVLRYGNGQGANFKDLAGLVSYLKTQYPAVKQQMAQADATPTVKKIAAFPPETHPKVQELLYKGNFKYDGAVHGQSSTGYSYINPSKDEIVLFPGGKSEVRDSSSPTIVTPYENAGQLVEYLQEKFGSNPMPTVTA